jgi:hypothetical protein
MDGIDAVHGDDTGAGHDSPAQRPLEGAAGGRGEIIVGGGRLRVVQATEEEQAAIRAMLSKRAESAPVGAGVGRASALAWAGLKLAAIVLLAAGVGVGLGDGDEFDDVGCSVAQQPGGTSHGARSAQARERADGKLAGSDGGSAGGSGDGGPGGRPECEMRAAMCAHRMADGQCQRLNQHCRLFAGASRVGEVGAARKTEIGKAETFPTNLLKQVLVSTLEQQAAMERFEGKLAGVRKDFADWQKSPRPANKAGQAEPPEPSPPNETNLSLAAKVFELLTALDPDNRLRKAPPIKVFLLHFRQNLSRSQVARVCGCSRTLVAERLRSIRDKLPWQPHQLRELSAHVEAM